MSTVLVVEHDPAVRDLLRQQLVDQHEILEATSPMEALDVCRIHGEIEVLVCDVESGLVSGMELATLLRAWLPRLRTILISNLPCDQWTDRQEMELTELPADAVLILERPFRGLELRIALSTLISDAVVSVT